MNKPHKHAALIKAWADGAEIEYLDSEPSEWRTIISPVWHEDKYYRIKPKPDVVMYGYAETKGICRFSMYRVDKDNLKLTCDGDTGKLKAAEVLQ